MGAFATVEITARVEMSAAATSVVEGAAIVAMVAAAVPVVVPVECLHVMAGAIRATIVAGVAAVCAAELLAVWPADSALIREATPSTTISLPVRRLGKLLIPTTRFEGRATSSRPTRPRLVRTDWSNLIQTA